MPTTRPGRPASAGTHRARQDLAGRAALAEGCPSFCWIGDSTRGRRSVSARTSSDRIAGGQPVPLTATSNAALRRGADRGQQEGRQAGGRMPGLAYCIGNEQGHRHDARMMDTRRDRQEQSTAVHAHRADAPCALLEDRRAGQDAAPARRSA